MDEYWENKPKKKSIKLKKNNYEQIFAVENGHTYLIILIEF